MNFEVEISYKANLDIRHIYEYYVMNNFDLNYAKHLINGIVSPVSYTHLTLPTILRV